MMSVASKMYIFGLPVLFIVRLYLILLQSNLTVANRPDLFSNCNPISAVSSMLFVHHSSAPMITGTILLFYFKFNTFYVTNKTANENIIQIHM